MFAQVQRICSLESLRVLIDLQILYLKLGYNLILFWFGLYHCSQYVKQVFTSCDDLLRKKQFCYILARHVSSPLFYSVIFWLTMSLCGFPFMDSLSSQCPLFPSLPNTSLLTPHSLPQRVTSAGFIACDIDQFYLRWFISDC